MISSLFLLHSILTLDHIDRKWLLVVFVQRCYVTLCEMDLIESVHLFIDLLDLYLIFFIQRRDMHKIQDILFELTVQVIMSEF